ncbi:histone-lysine N-methyltransferase SETMAR [Trichonephila clavipes]|nr:histone-lysine N-methyltransferase SETMAR [Trichonephila clavipes]
MTTNEDVHYNDVILTDNEEFMVWMSISFALVFICDMLTIRRYVDEILRPVVLPFLFWMTGVIFQRVPHTVTANYVQFWFRRFRLGIFNVKVAPHPDRPVVEIVDKITEIIEVDRHILTKQNEIDPFLKRMVTGDKKWVTYDNIMRKRSWSKRGEAAQTMGQTLNSDLSCQRLNHLKLATDQKRPEWANRGGVVYHQDNATPHTSVVTHQKLWELGWEVVMHPPYSPDLAPNDYHLFLSLQTFLSDKKLGSREDCENRLLEFFPDKG